MDRGWHRAPGLRPGRDSILSCDTTRRGTRSFTRPPPPHLCATNSGLVDGAEARLDRSWITAPSIRSRAVGGNRMELRSLAEIQHATAALAARSVEALDRLVWTGVFGSSELRERTRAAVLDQVRSAGIYPASIHDLYLARGRGEEPADFTVPAINIRGAAYDTARALFRARRKVDVGAVIFGIGVSTTDY